MRHRARVSGLSLLLSILLAIPGQAQKFFRLHGGPLPNPMALHTERGQPEYGRIQSGWWSAQWQVVSAAQNSRDELNAPFALRNRYTGTYLTVDSSSAGAAGWSYRLALTAAAPVLPGDSTQPQLWRLERRDPGVLAGTLRHRRTGLVVQVTDGTVPPSGYLARVAGTPPVVVLEVVDGGERPVTTAPPLAEPEAYVLLRTGWSDQIKKCGNPAVEGMEPRYLNIEHGVVDVTPIASDWLSARWGILKVGQDSIGERWALKNQWTGAYLVLVGGQVETGPTPLTGEGVGPGVWTVERGDMPPTQFRLRSDDRTVHVGPCPWVIEPVPVAPAPVVVVYTRLAAALDPAARIHAEQGTPAIDRVPDAWYSAMWEIERQPGNLVTFRNRWKGGYLNAWSSGLALGREGFNASGKGTGIWKYFPPQASRGARLTRTPRMMVLQNTATGTILCLTGSGPGRYGLALCTGESDEALWLFEDVK